MDNYIIYEVQYKGRTVYIGSGAPERYNHAVSGKSHVVDLNRLYFTDPENLKVTVIREGLTKDESLEYEKEYIQAIEPIYNTVHTRRNKKTGRKNSNIRNV